MRASTRLTIGGAVRCIWSAAVALIPLRLAGQAVRADIFLVNGRTAGISRPKLQWRSNPGLTPPLYSPAGVVTFQSHPRRSEDKALRWRDVWRIDYYPVDRGANCAAILTFRDATKLGVKGQVVFDASDEGITRQLPKGVISALRSFRWHREYKPLTAPAGLHHLEAFGAEHYPGVWDILQCAHFDSSATSERLHVKSIVFAAR